MIDFSKPVQTRDGKPVEIISTKAGFTKNLIVGYVGTETKTRSFTATGRYWREDLAPHDFDLINVPEPVVSWHNVYRGGVAYGHETHKEADKNADNCRIALLKLTYYPGHATVEIVEERK
jgi:hypothetical protein